MHPTTRVCFVLADLVTVAELDAIQVAAAGGPSGAREFAALYTGPYRSERGIADMFGQWLWLPVQPEPLLASGALALALDDTPDAPECVAGGTLLRLAHRHAGASIAVVLKAQHFEHIEAELVGLAAAWGRVTRRTAPHAAVRTMEFRMPAVLPDPVDAAGHEHEVRRFLLERGAGALPHPGGTLMAHLARTAELLQGWGASVVLTTAGLCHAVYGTDGYEPKLLPLEARCSFAGLVGAECEAIIYTYASCDRAAGYPSEQRPQIHDRFTGQDVPLTSQMVCEQLTLHCANSLDLLQQPQALSPTEAGGALRFIERCTVSLAPSVAGAVREALQQLCAERPWLGDPLNDAI